MSPHNDSDQNTITTINIPMLLYFQTGELVIVICFMMHKPHISTTVRTRDHSPPAGMGGSVVLFLGEGGAGLPPHLHDSLTVLSFSFFRYPRQ